MSAEELVANVLEGDPKQRFSWASIASQLPALIPATIQPPTLLTFGELPQWMQSESNPLILTSYRPQLQSIPLLLQSLFYSHNELVNVWTHLIPSLYYAKAFIFPELRDYNTPSDALAVRIYALSCALCFGMSAANHLGSAHSCKAAKDLSRLDYAGIALSMTTTSATATYTGLRNVAPEIMKPHLVLLTLSGIMVVAILCQEKRQGKAAARLRTMAFGTLVTAAYAPIVHALWILGPEGVRDWPMIAAFGVTASLMGAAMAYLGGWPESRYPEKFDVLGASHQIFHLFSLLATVVWWIGLRAKLSII